PAAAAGGPPPFTLPRSISCLLARPPTWVCAMLLAVTLDLPSPWTLPIAADCLLARPPTWVWAAFFRFTSDLPCAWAPAAKAAVMAAAMKSFEVCFMMVPVNGWSDCLVPGAFTSAEPATDTLANSVAMPWQKVQTSRNADRSVGRKAVALAPARFGDTRRRP